MTTLRICGLAAVLALAAVAFAYPTLYGPTGQAVIPTAFTAGGGLHLAADWQETEGGNIIPARAILGLGPNAELGVAYAPFDDDPAVDQLIGANAKLSFGDILGGRAAVGAVLSRFELSEDLELTDDEVDFTQIYFAWTRCFGVGAEDSSPNLGLTVGVNWTSTDPNEELEPFVPDDDALRLFAGVAFAISPSIELLGEWQAEAEEVGDTDPITAVTARFFMGNNLALQAGYTNAIGPIGTDDHNLFAGLSFGFGGSSE